MKYELKCAEQGQEPMFYSGIHTPLQKACVGHLRMDFGSGKEFWSTWWGNREDLNDSVFKAELNAVVNQLRKDGLLKDRYSMQKVCSDKSNLALGESHGFSVESENHLFFLRCLPLPGNYDCYCYCYNKHELKLAQEQGETQSPEMLL